MAMALHVLSDDGAVEHVEGGEQRGGTMAFVVVGHGAGAARLHRQSRLGAVKSLDLAFFIDREHHGMVGRLDVEADNILELVSTFRIVRQLERADAMRRELMGLKDRTQAYAGCLGQHSSSPMCRLSRR